MPVIISAASLISIGVALFGVWISYQNRPDQQNRDLRLEKLELAPLKDTIVIYSLPVQRADSTKKDSL